ncbi:MAG: hypothetical protein JKY37_17125, partial [Nannocystaceae bacterium]|nr:hypothetical protein [Nannocystaceae bacterium]
MSEPNDFDPIAASLRRQFSPPSLERLDDHVAKAAAQCEQEATQPADIAAADTEESVGPPGRARSRRWGLGFAVAFAAAAIVLVALRPWQPATHEDPSQAADPSAGLGPIALAPTSRQLAGLQLDRFLSQRDSLPGDDPTCSVTVPPQNCESAVEGPHLVWSPTVEQVGECGGTTGQDCSEYDLPADRALIVRLQPSGANAIVCIEYPRTDPTRSFRWAARTIFSAATWAHTSSTRSRRCLVRRPPSFFACNCKTRAPCEHGLGVMDVASTL